MPGSPRAGAGRGRSTRRSRHHRNAARVLPLPGRGVDQRAAPGGDGRPARVTWAGVGASNVASNQARTAGPKGASGSLLRRGHGTPSIGPAVPFRTDVLAARCPQATPVTVRERLRRERACGRAGAPGSSLRVIAGGRGRPVAPDERRMSPEVFTHRHDGQRPPGRGPGNATWSGRWAPRSVASARTRASARPSSHGRRGSRRRISRTCEAGLRRAQPRGPAARRHGAWRGPVDPVLPAGPVPWSADRHQLAMAGGLLPALAPRWRAGPEVAVYRPVRA